MHEKSTIIFRYEWDKETELQSYRVKVLLRCYTSNVYNNNQKTDLIKPDLTNFKSKTLRFVGLYSLLSDFEKQQKYFVQTGFAHLTHKEFFCAIISFMDL